MNGIVINLKSVIDKFQKNYFNRFLLFFIFSLSLFLCFSDEKKAINEEKKISNVDEEALTQPITEETPIELDEADKKDNLGSNLPKELDLKLTGSGESHVSNILRLILSLIFVLFLAFVVIKFMKKANVFSVNNDEYLKLVANLNVEQGKSIKVFTIGDKAYIVGVTSNNITKIAEIEDKDLINAMNLKVGSMEPFENSSFIKVFSNFFPIKNSKKVKKNDENDFSMNFLNMQQERIKHINVQDEDDIGEKKV